jgi:polyphenol oxidase
MASQKGSGAVGPRGSSPNSERQISPIEAVSEVPIPGSIPRFELPQWRERYGVVAGITGRGAESERGFDLGLWSHEPVGEVMNRWLAFRRANPEFTAVVLGNQVHGVEVRQVDIGQGWIQIEGVDGWVSTRPGVLLAVTVADCIPVYLVAPGRGIALLHAGWRGTAGGILQRGLELLVRATSMAPADLIMHCGIGICGSCYEVGSEVLIGCGLRVEGQGPWHLDLRNHLVVQARAYGLRRITTSTWCSAHDNHQFFSHRRSGGRDGRMVAYLGSLLASNLHPE